MGRWVNKHNKLFPLQSANKVMGYKVFGLAFLVIFFTNALIFILNGGFSPKYFNESNEVIWYILKVILFNIFVPSIILFLGFLLSNFLAQKGITKLSSLFSGGKIEVVCTNCFDKKLGFDNTPCSCGGSFQDLSNFVWENEESDSDSLNIIVKSFPAQMFLMITKYYRSIEELPESVRCSFCFSIIKLNSKSKESRVVKCDICQQFNDYRIPMEYYCFGEINPKFNIDSIFLNNLDFHSNYSLLIFNKINKLRELSRLPSEIECPICEELIHIEENNRNSRFVFCQNCKANLNLSVKNKDIKVILKESATL